MLVRRDDAESVPSLEEAADIIDDRQPGRRLDHHVPQHVHRYDVIDGQDFIPAKSDYLVGAH